MSVKEYKVCSTLWSYCFHLISSHHVLIISFFNISTSNDISSSLDVNTYTVHQQHFKTWCLYTLLGGFMQSHSGVCLTSSVTMIKGYRSSERKLNMHQILNASSSEISRWFLLRFFLAHSVQHILLKSTRSKLSCTWSERQKDKDTQTWISITTNWKGNWTTQCCMLSSGTGPAFPGLPLEHW